ncbi:non-ribosomal peptide synthetase [Kibdelosporangium persicum]|uniref:Non-ribosomal peptide synthetase n=1 Tax=Kibdelosporangium persicum TaxID=2698649 RepID=A0ABX2FHG9_9PSEU|nr:non-ribosomal peptide synthetase [Kibdelosporangium persicum]NRN70853.1 Non-ribosomal peptide synthetase [Kibdelosporangium persicum]
MTSVLRDRLDLLAQDRRDRFLALLQCADGDRPPAAPIRRSGADSAPLAHPQNTLWSLDERPAVLSADNVTILFTVDGDVEPEALRRALGALAARHDALRISLPDNGSGPVQRVVTGSAAELPVITAEPGHVVATARTVAAKPFDLATGPLWRACLVTGGPGGHLLVFAASRLIFDDASVQVLLNDLAELYRAEVAGTAPELPALPIGYIDYTHWQHGATAGNKQARLMEYWRQQLQSPPVVDLPTDRPRPTGSTVTGASTRLPVDHELVGQVHELAAELAVPSSTVYLSALFVLLRRYSRQDGQIVGMPISGRDRPELAGLIGNFTDLLALRVDLAGAPTFRDVVRRVQLVVDGAKANAGLSFHDVVRALVSAGEVLMSQLVQIVFALRDPVEAPEFAGLRTGVDLPDPSIAPFDLAVHLVEAGPRPHVAAVYRTDLFDAGTIGDLLDRYLRLTASLAGDPGAPIARAELLAPAERDELLRRWDGLYRSSPPVTIHGWFADQAARSPEACAVVAGDERLTYRELNAKADALAEVLRASGARPGRIVAICLPRGAEYLVSVLAVLKAGAGFLPLDPSHPASRLLALLGDAAPAVVLTTSELTGVLSGTAWHTLTTADQAPEGATPGGGDAGPDDLAYVLYTSGSTGTPKGVLISHRAVVNFVEAMRDLFVLTPADRMLGYAATTFDVSVFEMFGALLTGGRLCLALDSDRLDIERLQRLLEQEGITVTDLPPSVMAMLEPERLERLRIVFVGGEAFPGELVNRWNPGRRFFNGYGPTECTVTMIVHECVGTWDSSPPIGLPIANHVAHVLDENLEPVPYGVPGELVIGGLGLAKGYLNEPGLTERKFIADPFGTAPGGRLYRTGDLVKRRRDGALVFLGRIDRQLKIRGMRIEPAEIEAALSGHADVRQVFADVWTDPQGEPHLVAYVSLAAGARTTPPDLRAHLITMLPPPVVPDRVVIVSELPLTSSGKVDRAALPAPEVVVARTDGADRSETERIIADELFGRALGVETVDSHTSFFELGGSSLQAAQVIFGIRRSFDVEVSVAHFFRDPTVAGLAAVVDRQRAAQLDDESLLEFLEGMSDDEADRIMRVEHMEEAG